MPFLALLLLPLLLPLLAPAVDGATTEALPMMNLTGGFDPLNPDLLLGYYAQVGVGYPGQAMRLQVDVNGALSWLYNCIWKVGCPLVDAQGAAFVVEYGPWRASANRFHSDWRNVCGGPASSCSVPDDLVTDYRLKTKSKDNANYGFHATDLFNPTVQGCIVRDTLPHSVSNGSLWYGEFTWFGCQFRNAPQPWPSPQYGDGVLSVSYGPGSIVTALSGESSTLAYTVAFCFAFSSPSVSPASSAAATSVQGDGVLRQGKELNGRKVAVGLGSSAGEGAGGGVLVTNSQRQDGSGWRHTELLPGGIDTAYPLRTYLGYAFNCSLGDLPLSSYITLNTTEPRTSIPDPLFSIFRREFIIKVMGPAAHPLNASSLAYFAALNASVLPVLGPHCYDASPLTNPDGALNYSRFPPFLIYLYDTKTSLVIPPEAYLYFAPADAVRQFLNRAAPALSPSTPVSPIVCYAVQRNTGAQYPLSEFVVGYPWLRGKYYHLDFDKLLFSWSPNSDCSSTSPYDLLAITRPPPPPSETPPLQQETTPRVYEMPVEGRLSFFTAPRVSGTPQGPFATAYLGKPSTPYALKLDTAAGVSWVQCACINSACANSSDSSTWLDPFNSGTYSPIDCSSPVCSFSRRVPAPGLQFGCVQDLKGTHLPGDDPYCAYSTQGGLGYVEGQGRSEGNVLGDFLSLAEWGGSSNKLSNAFYFGCGSYQTGLYKDPNYVQQGVLDLSLSAASLPSRAYSASISAANGRDNGTWNVAYASYAFCMETGEEEEWKESGLWLGPGFHASHFDGSTALTQAGAVPQLQASAMWFEGTILSNDSTFSIPLNISLSDPFTYFLGDSSQVYSDYYHFVDRFESSYGLQKYRLNGGWSKLGAEAKKTFAFQQLGDLPCYYKPNGVFDRTDFGNITLEFPEGGALDIPPEAYLFNITTTVLEDYIKSNQPPSAHNPPPQSANPPPSVPKGHRRPPPPPRPKPNQSLICLTVRPGSGYQIGHAWLRGRVMHVDYTPYVRQWAQGPSSTLPASGGVGSFSWSSISCSDAAKNNTLLANLFGQSPVAAPPPAPPAQAPPPPPNWARPQQAAAFWGLLLLPLATWALLQLPA